jgi:hypothetical protein
MGRALRLNSIRVMMLSGVFHPACMEIRRVLDIVPPNSTNYLPEFLNSFLEGPFGAVSRSNQMKKDMDDVKPRTAEVRSPYRRMHQQVPSRFSLKSILVQLGVLRSAGQRTRHILRYGQASKGRLEERIQALESLLKAEQACSRIPREELARLRFQVKRLEDLQTDLTIERESGKLLVQWLQGAEQKLADVDHRGCTLAR